MVDHNKIRELLQLEADGGSLPDRALATASIRIHEAGPLVVPVHAGFRAYFESTRSWWTR